MRIPTNDLRYLLSELFEDHAPGKLGGMFCVCELYERFKGLISELDAHRDGFLVLEHGKEDFIAKEFIKHVERLKREDPEKFQKLIEGNIEEAKPSAQVINGEDIPKADLCLIRYGIGKEGVKKLKKSSLEEAIDRADHQRAEDREARYVEEGLINPAADNIPGAKEAEDGETTDDSRNSDFYPL